MQYSVQFTRNKAVVGRTRTVGIRVLNVLKKYKKDVTNDFKYVTRFWEHDVAIKSEMRYRGGDIFVLVGADDEIFGYISGGTDVRYATMDQHFVRKTNPGTLETFPGHGGLLFVSKKFPHPGIEARRYEVLIREKYEKQFPEDIRRAVFAGMFAFVQRGRR